MIARLVPLAVPLAARWVEQEQRRILAEGMALTAAQQDEARSVDVREPARVRVSRVERIPLPGDPLVRWANRAVRLVSEDTAGITFGHGIYIHARYWGDRLLLLHELVHVGQYERLGGVRPFLRLYLEECLVVGYPNGPLEMEAIRRTAEMGG